MSESECSEIAERLLRGDDPSNPPIDLRDHLAGCVECRRLADSLVLVERALRSLPIPPDSSAARDRFLRGLHSAPAPVPFPRVRHKRRAAAVLAAALIGAFTIWMFPPSGQREARAADPVDELLEWNLRLSEAGSPAERERLALTWRAASRGIAAPSSRDRELADALSANAEWLADHDDPAAGAVRFADVVDRLVSRLRDPLDAASAERDGRRLELVIERGVAANIVRARASDPQTSAVRVQVSKSAEVLRELADRVPASARPGVSRALQAADRHGFVPPGLRKSGGAEAAPDGSFVPPGLAKKAKAGAQGKAVAKEKASKDKTGKDPEDED